MNQTSAIAASLIIAFLVFVTVRGELPAYLSVFTGSSPTPTNTVAGAVKETASNFIGGTPQENPLVSFPGWKGLGGFGDIGGFGGGTSTFSPSPELLGL